MNTINMDLPLKLSRKTKSSKSRQHKRVLGTSIEERPDHIDNREEFGQWEIDSVLGYKSKDNALLTLVERKTRNKVIKRIESKDVPSVHKALDDIFINVKISMYTFDCLRMYNLV